MTLKIYSFLSFLIMVFTVRCSSDPLINVEDALVELRTSNKQLQSNFDSCVRMTQQLIKAQVSDKEFYEYFRFDTGATGFEYDNVIQNVTDTLSKMPKGYQIFYDFIYKGEPLSSFRADFDSTLKVIDYRNFHLTAFRQFIDKKLTITRARATHIALKNGMKTENLELIFSCSGDKFYWKGKNVCDGCSYLDIDAQNGNIIRQGKVVYQY